MDPTAPTAPEAAAGPALLLAQAPADTAPLPPAAAPSAAGGDAPAGSVVPGVDGLAAGAGDAAASDPLSAMTSFVETGGAAMAVIAALSVATVALIVWKILRLLAFGAWSGGRHSEQAIALWSAGRHGEALAVVASRRSLRARLVAAAMTAAADPALDDGAAQAETARVARRLLMQARAGLRGLELASTVGPLLGLLGTVLGMIAAFRALQEAGTRADPATLAGGIWEALLTTAAGMAVAIPAQIALTWFESVVDRLRHDMEDAATRIFQRRPVRPAPRGSRPVGAAAE